MRRWDGPRLHCDGPSLDLDVAGATARVQAGCSLDALLRVIVPRGMFVPVSPGTSHVTVGGAIASDVHGKNHHCDGTSAHMCEDCELATPSGVFECGPDKDEELFWATAGGMGLTGVITEATLRLVPIETSRMLVDTERACRPRLLHGRMTESDADHRYSVAWVDSLARGRHLGPVGDHDGRPCGHLGPSQSSCGAILWLSRPRQLLELPGTPPVLMLNPRHRGRVQRGLVPACTSAADR